MFVSRYLPCADCGESVERSVASGHRCSTERMVDFQMFGLREDIARLEDRLWDFLDTSHGRFAAWLAARQVRA
jgi:hypothetical protein